MTRNTLRDRLVNMGLHTDRVNKILGLVDEHVAWMVERHARPPLKTRPGDWARRPGVTRYWPQDGAS